MAALKSEAPSANMTETLPQFNAAGSLYNQNTYTGRVRHFMSIFDPKLCTVTSPQLEHAKQLLKDYASGDIKNNSPSVNQQLWNAKRITDSMIHPQTGDVIPLYGRFCAFVPMNIPVLTGMLSVTSPAGIALFQVLNQSYNVLMNVCNANKTNPPPPWKIGAAYAGAVTVSCSIALGLDRVVQRLKTPGVWGALARVLVPYTAVATAGCANLLFMRANEMQTGVGVETESGESVGISKSAAKKAIFQTCLTRIVLPGPIIIVPGIIMSALDSSSIFKRAPKIRLPVNVAVIAGCLWGALPAAIGLFPQRASVDALDLEPEFHNRVDSRGQPISKLFYNKGL